MKEEVERFRLTKEQLAFQKTYKRLLGVAKVLQARAHQTAREGASLGQLMQEVNGQMTELLSMAPRKPVHELDGETL